MLEPANDLVAFAALKGWRVTTGSDGQLFCRGREAGLRWHVWTHPPILGPLLTMVVEAKSGLTFELVSGPKIRPGLLEHAVEEDSEGRKHLVKVREISPAVESWINSIETNSFTRLALTEHEEISVNPETVAITFQAKGLDHALYRGRTLLEFVALLPTREPHTLPKELRPIAPLIRAWSVTDDAKREARLAAASRLQLEGLASAWRDHLDLINATIEHRPESDLSNRLMAFSQAAMEAERQIRNGTN
jgi:hypothetical protein